jgi:hypothetical protein
MRGGTLTWMAVRELWISFRFLALLSLGLVGGLLATAVRASLSDGQALLAGGIAGAGIAAAGIGAMALAGERRSGRLAWLAVRSVPRSAALLAWFVSLSLPLMAGLAISGVLGWIVVGAPSAPPMDGPAFAALVTAAAATSLEGLAVALLAGILLRPVSAAIVAMIATAALMGTGLAVVAEPPALPAAGIGLLANAQSLGHPVSDGLQAMGMALAATGLLLAVAAAALSRVDL